MSRLRWVLPALLALACIWLLLAGASSAGTAPSLRIDEFYIHQDGGGPPDIDGDQLVWTHNAGIHRYDLSLHENLPGFAEATHATGPKISGDWIAWSDNDPDGGYDRYRVVAKNTKTGEFRTITSGDHSPFAGPAIDGDYIAWTDNDGHLWLYSITATASTLITDTGSNWSPDIDWPWMVWKQQEVDDPMIWAYHLTTTAVLPVWAEESANGPKVSDSLAVWRESTPLPLGSWNIYGADLRNGQRFTVTHNSCDNTAAHIDGHLIVYRSECGGRRHNRLYDMTTGADYTATWPIHSDDPARISGNTIVWNRFIDWPQVWHLYGARIHRISHLPCVLKAGR